MITTVFDLLIEEGVSEETASDLKDLAWGNAVLAEVLANLESGMREGEKSTVELLALALCRESANFAHIVGQIINRQGFMAPPAKATK